MQDKLKKLITDLYSTRNELRELFDNKWKFTLDGNLVGDIGEAIAFHHFDLVQLKRGQKTHDAKTKDGKKYVQIKATQDERVGLGLEKRDFKYLLVFKINNDGTYSLIYNGPGKKVWDNTNSKSISLKKLEDLQNEVSESDKLKVKKGSLI